MKLVFHDDAGPDLAARLAGFAAQGLRIAICPPRDDAALTALLGEMEVLWHVLSPCTGAMIAAAPRLRLIQKIGVGVNTIDLDAARARAIPVCNLPGTNAAAVAEMTLALMLAATRRLERFGAALRAGAWTGSGTLRDGIGELGGRTVGLVGYGAIPQALTPVLAALGCRVLYTARTRRAAAQAAWRDLPGLLAESDIVSLHLPLEPATAQLIDAAAIARMKPGAVLINTARGGLVDQAALVAALRSGKISAAGLDVFATEPPDPADPLLALPNVVATPHIAWLTRDTFARSFALAAENCRRLAAGEALLHRVA
ncbi:MAG: 2-hydroxyacid dehydrogenase [Rhodospirillales bacterium]|nr:2-hydroxyacid dehydrogenase [Rhodospirillales bacterium]